MHVHTPCLLTHDELGVIHTDLDRTAVKIDDYIKRLIGWQVCPRYSLVNSVDRQMEVTFRCDDHTQFVSNRLIHE